MTPHPVPTSAPTAGPWPDLAAPVRVEVLPPAADSGESPRITVILPVYKEAASAGHIVAEVAAFADDHPDYHFIFVDDGSPDGTSAAIDAALTTESQARPEAASRIRRIGYRANGGKGHAVARGVAEARGRDTDPVLFTDGDLAYSLDHLPTLVQALRTHDVVLGSRREATGAYAANPMRFIMGWAYNRMARLCLGAPYRDTQAGLKGFRLGAARKIFPALRVTGFGFDVELLYLARRFGYTITEVPAKVSAAHKAKPSRVNLLREPRRMFMNLAGVRLNGLIGTYDRAADGRRPIAAISFDAEEFDIPAEFGHAIDADRQMRVGAEGMRLALDVLDEAGARATFFCTAAFALEHPLLIRHAVAAGHEIASHSRVHTGFVDADLKTSREQLEDVAGVPVRGFRRPRFAPTDAAKLLDAGYTYDSSINPIWMPGRYNGWKHPRKPFFEGDLLRIPVAATPLIRWPLFWLTFKNAPQWSTRVATRSCLSIDGLLPLVYHPWELCDLSGYGLPGYVRRIDGRSMQSRLLRYFRWLARRSTLVTYSQIEARKRAGVWPFGDPVALPAPAPEPARTSA